MESKDGVDLTIISIMLYTSVYNGLHFMVVSLFGCNSGKCGAISLFSLICAKDAVIVIWLYRHIRFSHNLWSTKAFHKINSV